MNARIERPPPPRLLDRLISWLRGDEGPRPPPPPPRVAPRTDEFTHWNDPGRRWR